MRDVARDLIGLVGLGEPLVNHVPLVYAVGDIGVGGRHGRRDQDRSRAAQGEAERAASTDLVPLQVLDLLHGAQDWPSAPLPPILCPFRSSTFCTGKLVNSCWLSPVAWARTT